MNGIFNIRKKIKKIYLSYVFLFFLIFLINSQIVDAITMNTYQNKFVTEELRLKIPLNYKEAWLKAESKIWEPWLSNQNGFMGRQIFWDKEKEEALILINWESKQLWKSISMQEVNKIQGQFEENVKLSLGLNENPFKLIYEGELVKQG